MLMLCYNINPFIINHFFLKSLFYFYCSETTQQDEFNKKNNLIFIGEFQPCNEQYYNPIHGDCITDSIILQNNITYKSSITKYITGHVINVNDKLITSNDYVNIDNEVNNDHLLFSNNSNYCNSNSITTSDTVTTVTSTGITSTRIMRRHITHVSFISKPWQYIHDDNWNQVTNNHGKSGSRNGNCNTSSNSFLHCFVVSVLLPHYNNDGNYRLKVISQFKSTSFQINCQNRSLKNNFNALAPLKESINLVAPYNKYGSESPVLFVKHSEIINVSDVDDDDDLYQQNLLISILQNLQYKKYEEYKDNINDDPDNDDNNSGTTTASVNSFSSQLSVKRHSTYSSCKSSPLSSVAVAVADDDEEEEVDVFYEPFFKYCKK